MGGKHKNWHKAWRRDGARLVHISGAVFVIECGDGFTDIKAAPETLAEFQRYELARGVPVHDLAQRLMRLAREAGDWLKNQE
jgi:hypothetical protein